MEELQAYLGDRFNTSEISFPLSAQLAEPDYVDTWRHYLAKAEQTSVFAVLQESLVQLQFPVEQGISQSPAYRAATRRGKSTEQMPEAVGLTLQEPERIQLSIHQSVAGAVPVIFVPNRADFVTLVQAFVTRNEPAAIPDSMGACMVKGYNNWERISRHRACWEAENPDKTSEMDWAIEFQRIVPQKHLYQDRFIILSAGPYSGVSAEDMDLDEESWHNYSQIIRLEHECTHYLTERVLGLARHHVFDELLADYAGIVAAVGQYRAGWFLHFMGLENFPHYREDGRLQYYVADLQLSEQALQTLREQLKIAAENLERFDAELEAAERDKQERPLVLLAIACLTLAELASENGRSLLMQSLNELKKQQGVSEARAASA